MEDINKAIHEQLKAYAQQLFTATVNAYTSDGKCSLKPGKYSANEMQRENFMKIHETQTAHALTSEDMCKEITVTAGEFCATFMYYDIFEVLDNWERMMRAGKNKAVFEIGDIEIISAKVLTDEKTELGTYKEKRMKLQKLHGNWYAPARFKKSDYKTGIYYKHDNVIFCGGELPTASFDESNRVALIARLDEVESSLTKSLLDLAERNEYFAEVCKRMNIEAQQPATASEAPQISTEAAEVTNVSAEGEIREIRHISEIMETCPIVVKCCCDPDGEHIYTDEYNYYSWLRNAETIGYQTIADKALTEAWTNIFLAAYRRGKGHVLVINNRGELVDTIFVSPTSEPIEKLEHLPQPPKSAPQSTQTPRTVKCITPTRKRRQNANKRLKSASQYFRTTRRNTLRYTLRSVTYVPRRYSTAKSPPYRYTPTNSPYW